MRILLALLATFISYRVLAATEYDFIAKQNLAIVHANPESILNKTAANVRSLFERYQVGLDSSSEIVSPLQVGGTQSRPVIKVSVKKCVAFICETVALDAEIALTETRGNCQRNFLLQADLSRSSRRLTEVYDRLDVVICFKSVRPGEAALELSGYAHRAESYAGGTVQRQIFEFLKLQIHPIAKALTETLRSHGAK